MRELNGARGPKQSITMADRKHFFSGMATYNTNPT